MKKLIILALISISFTCNAQTQIEQMVTEVNSILNRPVTPVTTPVEYYYSQKIVPQYTTPIYTVPNVPIMPINIIVPVNPMILPNVIMTPQGVITCPIITTPTLDMTHRLLSEFPIIKDK